MRTILIFACIIIVGFGCVTVRHDDSIGTLINGQVPPKLATFLRFTGYRAEPNGMRQFLVAIGHQPRVYFAHLGAVVDGFKIVKFEEKKEDTPMGQSDVSVLTLEHKGRLIRLIKGVSTQYTE